MATIKEQLTELKGFVTDFAGDVDAKLDQLAQAQGTFDPEAQAIFDDIKATVARADAKVGDADGSETPAEPTDPAEPDAPTPLPGPDDVPSVTDPSLPTDGNPGGEPAGPVQ